MEIDDPAWFYLSLAQTAAAIVGLIGAVLGSRIIDHLSRLREQRRAVASQLEGMYSRIRSSCVRSLGLDDGHQHPLAAVHAARVGRVWPQGDDALGVRLGSVGAWSVLHWPTHTPWPRSMLPWLVEPAKPAAAQAATETAADVPKSAGEAAKPAEAAPKPAADHPANTAAEAATPPARGPGGRG
jgi:hypothetical protein